MFITCYTRTFISHINTQKLNDLCIRNMSRLGIHVLNNVHAIYIEYSGTFLAPQLYKDSAHCNVGARIHTSYPLVSLFAMN